MQTTYLEADRPRRCIGGAITALVTPFRDDVLDRIGLMAHVEWQILNGIDGLAVCGLAGEGPVLTETERQTIIGTCVEIAEARLPVIAATGSNCTAGTIEATRQARAAGADAALITVPYYSKPTQQGILAHFARVAEAVDLPIVIDNQPAHAGVDLLPATIERLGVIDSLIGIVDGTGDVARPALWAPLLPARVGLYSSCEPAALGFTLAGGSGRFSDSANIAPRLIAALQHAAAAGNLQAADKVQARLLPLWQALGRDGTPAGIKHALSLERATSATMRLPLVGVEPAVDAAIRDALAHLQPGRHESGSAPIDPFRTALPL